MADLLNPIYPVACHTDNIGNDSVFVAIKGKKFDGADFIADAIKKGAKKIVIEQASPGFDTNLFKNIEIVITDNARKELAILSAQASDFAHKKLKIIAVTGTKGKTTTAYAIEHLLRSAGLRTALLSTVENKILDRIERSTLTTCQPDYLHQFFDQCVKENIDYVVMEVAAQAISLYRVYGLEFEVVVFTNFSQEHGEFYKTQQEYFNDKIAILDQVKKDGLVILNADDKEVIAQQNKYKNVRTFGINAGSLQAKIIESNLDGTSFEINLRGKLENLKTKLIGKFNIYNILAAMLIYEQINLSIQSLQNHLNTLIKIPGRLEKIMLPNGACAFIDYAHNPSSFESIISTMANEAQHLIVLFGAGGDRDKEKRPMMGNIALKYADRIIVTSDNPRSEDPKEITNQIVSQIPFREFKKIYIELDRKLAIEKAYKISEPGSIVLLLGKGPDEYQIVNGVKTKFSEREILASL